MAVIDATPAVVAPGQKLRRGAAVGPPRVRVADVRREEFQETERGAFAGCCDQRGHDMRGTAGDKLALVDDSGDFVSHPSHQRRQFGQSDECHAVGLF
jgi:hypothetical protein